MIPVGGKPLLFWDDQAGGWYSTTGRDPSVLLRMKEEYDGAEPSASSVGVSNLIVLSHLVDDREWRDRIERTLRLFGKRLEQAGRAVPMMASALSTYAAGVQQVVIVGGDDGPDALTKAMALQYRPFTILLRVAPDRLATLGSRLPFVASMRPVDGAATAYVCRDFACRQPVTTVEALQEELKATA